MRIIFILSAVALAASSLKAGWMQHAGAWWGQVFSGQGDSNETAALNGRAITSLLAGRQRRNAGPLLPDEELRQWMLGRLESDTGDVDALLKGAQKACPHYLQVAALKVRHATSAGLLEQMSTWPELGTKELTHVSAVVKPAAFGLGWQAVILAGQRLPAFSPEALSDPEQHLFYSSCAFCRRGQPCEVPRHSRSLSLECPHCHRVYAMLAADTEGKFRYVNEFLTGYAPPARYPEDQTRLEQLIAIWRAVTTGCHYVLDHGDDQQDAWQTAQQTQALGQGDCEDSSILLADWLISREFEARVALGRYAERGGHAWVVVRLDGQDYLLESTEGSPEASRPPLLAEVGSRYVPEVLFDHLSFYIRKEPQQLWNNDYWHESTWHRVAPRPRHAGRGGLPPAPSSGAHSIMCFTNGPRLFQSTGRPQASSSRNTSHRPHAPSQ